MKSKSSKTPPAAAPQSALGLAGEQFDDFRIERQLGQGGMGEVYLAEQISLGRKVAIKVLRDTLADKPAALARFQAESKTVAQISHANVVQVYMIGERQGRSYMVLEYVEGKSLGEYLARQGPLEVPLVLSLMRQVVTALHHASALGIVHRDIKPANILLTRKGRAKIADFGLARCLDQEQPVDLTRSGTTVGTPLYMSPEQIEGKTVDSRSDIYSFGVTCYHMLAGYPPFQGSNAFEVAVKHVREEPPPLETIRPEIPPALLAIVRKMMAKKRNARYQSAQELLEDIARVRAALSGATESVSLQSDATETIPMAESAESIPVPVSNNSALLFAGLGVLALATLVAALIGVGIFWQLNTVRPVTDTVAITNLPPDISTPAGEKLQRKQTLEKVVEQHLAEKSPNPGRTAGSAGGGTDGSGPGPGPPPSRPPCTLPKTRGRTIRMPQFVHEEHRRRDLDGTLPARADDGQRVWRNRLRKATGSELASSRDMQTTFKK